jgi:GNAT superfamily N-acetyltransferase
MLRIFEDDYGYGYQPEWQWDYDDLAGTYIEHPRQTLLLALDAASGEVVGTGAIRAGGPRSPAWLAARYQPPEQIAQIVRLFVHPAHRRRGVARLLVDELQRFVQGVGGYRVICLHTETVPEFWQRLGCQLIHDGRTADPPEPSVHFELPLPEIT